MRWRLRRRRTSLECLLRRRASLKGLLLGSLLLLLLELLGLLPRIACILGLLLLRLLSKALRLAREASHLRLHWSSTKACRLRSHSSLEVALEAAGLLEGLLLLAILWLPRSGAIAAP